MTWWGQSKVNILAKGRQVLLKSRPIRMHAFRTTSPTQPNPSLHKNRTSTTIDARHQSWSYLYQHIDFFYSSRCQCHWNFSQPFVSLCQNWERPCWYKCNFQWKLSQRCFCSWQPICQTQTVFTNGHMDQWTLTDNQGPVDIPSPSHKLNKKRYGNYKNHPTYMELWVKV